MRFLQWLVAFSAVATATAPADTQSDRHKPTDTLILRRATVIPMDGPAVPLAHHTVIVRGNRVDWVGPDKSAPKIDGARVIDARGKFLIPGLTDAHVHLFDESQLAVYLANGITTVFNMSGTPRILRWQREVASGERLGPTIFTTGPQIKDEPLPIYDGVVAVRSVADVPALIRAHVDMGYTSVKIWASLRPDIYDAILRECGRHGLRVTGHVPSRVGLKGALASGQESVAHLEEILNKFFLRNLDPAGFANAAAILSEKRAPVITTLMTYDMIVDTGGDDSLAARLARPENRFFDPALIELWKPARNEYRNLRRRRDAFAKAQAFQIQMAKALHDRGVVLLAGTDAGLFMPNILPGFSLHGELALLEQSGLTASDVLRAATAAPGEYLDPGSGRGTIRRGAPADLLLLDQNPLESASNARSIRALVASGTFYSRKQLDRMLNSTAARHAKAKKFVSEILASDSDSFAPLIARAQQSEIAPSETCLMTLAYALFKDERQNDAVALARLAHRRYPSSYLTAYFHAGLLEMSGKLPESRAALREVLRLAPDHAQARLQLAADERAGG